MLQLWHLGLSLFAAVQASAGAAPCEPGESAAAPGLHRFQLSVLGTPRFFVLYVPEQEEGHGTRQLWVLAPGAYNTPGKQIHMSDLAPFAKKRRIAFLALEGEQNLMNVEMGGQALEEGPADVEYTRLAIQQATGQMCVDPRKVFCVGYSRGARFCSRLASELTGTFSAFGMVSGIRFPRPNNASRPTPIIAFHGTGDPINPFDGNANNNYWRSTVPDAVSQWAQFNNCTTMTEKKVGVNVTLQKYTNCAANADVLLFKIAGGGHTWPGSTFAFDEGLGYTTPEVSANDEFLKFFSAASQGAGVAPPSLSLGGGAPAASSSSAASTTSPTAAASVAATTAIAAASTTAAATTTTISATTSSLTSATQSGTVHETPVPGVVVSVAEAPPCFQEHTAYEPIDAFLPSRQKDVKACQQHCANTTGCAHFSFYGPLRHCHLQGELAIRQPLRPGWTAGSFRCWDGSAVDQLATANMPAENDAQRARSFGCLEVGTAFSLGVLDATRLSIHSRRDAVAYCMDWCNTTAGCTGFTMQFPTHACSLHGRGAMRLRSIMGAVSGPPACESRPASDHADTMSFKQTHAAVKTKTLFSVSDLIARSEATSAAGSLAPDRRSVALLDGGAAVVAAAVATVLAGLALTARARARRSQTLGPDAPGLEAQSGALVGGRGAPQE